MSGLLLCSLRSATEIEFLNLILKYCNKTRDHFINTIYLRNLLEKSATSDWVHFNWKHLSKDAHLKRLFLFGPGNSIKLKGRYAEHRTFICRKTKAYLKVISLMKSGSERFDDKLQDKVRVGVMLFNHGFFFECHEFLEEIWLKEKGREKAFLKGLIHACVAFYHLEYENIKGTVSYLKKSSSILKEFQPSFFGIDVRYFLSDIEKVLKVFAEPELRYAVDDIPAIKLIE